MSQSVKMPALGESVTEGTVTRWLKAEGDTVEVDEPLLEVSTDKVDTEIPSPVAGDAGEDPGRRGRDRRGGRRSRDHRRRLRRWSASAAERRPAGDAGSSAPQESAPAEDAEPEPEASSRAERACRGPVDRDRCARREADRRYRSGRRGSGTSVTLPAMGESVTEGTVTRWLKQVGDTVEVDEPLLEVSTDKVDTEVPSPVAGTLLKISVAEDETVEVGGELAVIGDAERRRRAASRARTGTRAEARARAEPSPNRSRSPNPSRGEARTGTGEARTGTRRCRNVRGAAPSAQTAGVGAAGPDRGGELAAAGQAVRRVRPTSPR